MRSFLRHVFPVLALVGIALDAAAAPVNINTADAPTLARELKGIGLKRAQAIVDYRSKNGPFKSADELRLVKGIGPQAIDRNRAEIRLDAAKPVAKPSASAPAAAQAAGAPAAPARKPATVAR